MQKIINNIANSVPVEDNTYTGTDGLIYCRNCGGARQVKISPLGKERIVNCICKCMAEKRDQENQRMQTDELERKRRTCFSQSNMHKWTFAADDKNNPKLSEAMQRYVDNFRTFLKEGKGLLLYGTVGTGKTFYAACIANALIDKEYRVLMTNFASLTNTLQGKFDGKQEYINSLNNYSLLIIDDLGAERKSEFMQEQVFNIIDSRYRAGLPMIITTNLTIDEIKKPSEIGNARIYDRILERCHPIEVTGGSRRRAKIKDEYNETQMLLGLGD